MQSELKKLDFEPWRLTHELNEKAPWTPTRFVLQSDRLHQIDTCWQCCVICNIKMQMFTNRCIKLAVRKDLVEEKSRRVCMIQ